MEVTGNPGGTGLLWTAMLTTLFVISRALTIHWRTLPIGRGIQAEP